MNVIFKITKLLIISGIISILVGCLFLTVGIHVYYKEKSIENWPLVFGTMISSEIGDLEDMNIIVRYNYTVNNIEYTSNQFSYCYQSNTLQEANMYLQKYAKENVVTVYYNPDNPSEAVLEWGLCDDNAFIGGFFGGIVFIIIGVFLIYFMKKSSNDYKK